MRFKERLTKRIHISWRLTAGAAGFLGGVFGSLFFVQTTFHRIELLVLALCFAVVGCMKPKLSGLLLLTVAGLLSGLYRGSMELANWSKLDAYIGQEVRLTGIVEQDPSIDVDGDTQLRLHEVTMGGRSVSGIVWVAVTGTETVRRSDTVTVEGQLSEGFGSMPAAMYRARVVTVLPTSEQDRALQVRDSFASSIRRSIDEPQASLGSGFLLGQKTMLPEKLDQELRLLGLTHIVVASGYNLTLIVRFARRFLSRVSRFTALAGTLGFMLFFVSMTGWSPSMTRAALITTVSLLCWYVGRRVHPVVLLTLTAAVTVVIRPYYAWGDVGWLLSFLSFVGVLILAPLLHAFFFGEKRPGSLRQVLFETISAQIMTAPLIMLLFSQYSPIALIANLLVVPIIPLSMFVTFLAGIAGYVGGLVAVFFGTIAQVPLGYVVRIVDFLATYPLAQREVAIALIHTLILYALIGLGIGLLWMKTRLSLRETNVIE